MCGAWHVVQVCSNTAIIIIIIAPLQWTEWIRVVYASCTPHTATQRLCRHTGHTMTINADERAKNETKTKFWCFARTFRSFGITSRVRVLGHVWTPNTHSPSGRVCWCHSLCVYTFFIVSIKKLSATVMAVMAVRPLCRATETRIISSSGSHLNCLLGIPFGIRIEHALPFHFN